MKPLSTRTRIVVNVIASTLIVLSLAGLAYLFVIFGDRGLNADAQGTAGYTTSGEMLLLVLCALGIIASIGGLVFAWARSRR